MNDRAKHMAIRIQTWPITITSTSATVIGLRDDYITQTQLIRVLLNFHPLVLSFISAHPSLGWHETGVTCADTSVPWQTAKTCSGKERDQHSKIILNCGVIITPLLSSWIQLCLRPLLSLPIHLSEPINSALCLVIWIVSAISKL